MTSAGEGLTMFALHLSRGAEIKISALVICVEATRSCTAAHADMLCKSGWIIFSPFLHPRNDKRLSQFAMPRSGGGGCLRVHSSAAKFQDEIPGGVKTRIGIYLMHAARLPRPAKCTERERKRETPRCELFLVLRQSLGWCHGAVIDRLCAWSSWASLLCRNTPFALLQYFHRGMQRIDTTECAHPLTHIAGRSAGLNLFSLLRQYTPNAHKAPQNAGQTTIKCLPNWHCENI